jgi:hypothetical protein
MTTLMLDAGPIADDALVTRVGGVPLAPAGTEWPSCAACAGPMQFLAQVLLADAGFPGGGPTGPGGPSGRSASQAVLALFACQNEPGMCDDWAPDSGGNRALLFPFDSARPLPLPAPAEGADPRVLLLGAVRAVGRVHDDEHDYDDASAAWAARTGRTENQVLGQLGGEPSWLQDDETPDCPGCGRPMPFVVQLQEGPEARTAMNFGSGSAYAFACEPCAAAAFLWQC